ncbi:hypothetical protein AB0D04_31835 [Streptomyces sp. NPDC048483]|uniref:hypothetical protein n=1 Tax=Streptomyces sp. NPDC048483 TaxID=3154927 RepID=UPI003428B6B9
MLVVVALAVDGFSFGAETIDEVSLLLMGLLISLQMPACYLLAAALAKPRTDEAAAGQERQEAPAAA